MIDPTRHLPLLGFFLHNLLIYNIVSSEMAFDRPKSNKCWLGIANPHLKLAARVGR